VAVYTLGVALLAPILIGKLGLPLMGTHLFLVFYASLSAITPPVAVANFAAAAISGANPMSVGPYACKLTVGGFIAPFFLLFNPGVLMQGGVVQIVAHSFIGTAMVVAASLAVHGWWGNRKIPWPARLVLAVTALAMIKPVPSIQWIAVAATLAACAGMWKLLPQDKTHPA